MKIIIKNLTVFLLGFAAFACDINNSPKSGQARVNFYLVDAPADFDEVWIEVLALRVKAENEESEMTEDDDSWNEIVFEGSRYVNLLDLTGGNSLLLGSEDFPEGNIDQIRLILGEDNYLTKDGERFELKTPSAQQSGLKIKVDQTLEAGNTYNLIIDFDMAKSIVVAGNSGNIILKPVLRAFLEQSQGVQGQVLPVEAQPVMITVTVNGIDLNTFADENGNYVIQGITPGTYDLTFMPNEGYEPVTVNGIVVEAEKVTTVPPVTLVEK
ncbi:DUF4382 domain-containing protein [Algoriphagus boritolerans]|uniref:Carboxypeptidase regulatory-like domain-containing protein n=1 Tax=Algoriphagus boritolerans DSM 17298 = JCM 18970 TaxID=1120964 RepID=A0A1H5YCS5_9BACT|nr:DUF4382 domain-containing protein [Algoriphagus boritolerans]SEG21863.1 Carboxypeptidase regulatory-like domain-containing protein [Algoriphagus boritolerans DSM 17298 = JCM 18970]